MTKMIIECLGTGAANGVPVIGCQCQHCKEARKIARQMKEDKILFRRNISVAKKRIPRKRSCVLIKSNDVNILLDCPPEIQSILNEYEVNEIAAIFLSHRHFDHILGLKEFEFWDKAIDFYGNADVVPIAKDLVKSGEGEINENFRFHILKNREIVNLKNFRIIPFKVEHKVPTFGYLFQKDGKSLMHFSDSTSKFDNWHIEVMQKADVVVFHTTTYDKITSDHISVKDVLNLNSRYEIKKIVLSHINHKNLTYEKLVKKLAQYDNIDVAYDGMEIEI